MIPNENDSYYIIADIKGLGKKLILNPEKKYSLQTIDLLLAGFKNPQENRALNGFTKKEFYENVAKSKNVDVKDIKDIYIVHVYLNKKDNVYNMTFHRPIYKDNYKDENIRIAQLNVIKMLRERVKNRRNTRIHLKNEPKIINYIERLMAKAYTDYNLLMKIGKGEIPTPPKIRILIEDYLHTKSLKDQQYVTNKICDSIERYSQIRQLATAILTQEGKKTYTYDQSTYPSIMFNKQEPQKKKRDKDQLDLFNDFGVKNTNNYNYNDNRRVEEKETTMNMQEQYVINLINQYNNGLISENDLIDTIYRYNDISELANMSEDTKRKLRNFGINTHKL